MTDSTERAQVGWGFWLWWMLASAVGLAVLGLVGWDVGGALGGAITGGVMVWLLRQPVTQEPSPLQEAV